MQSNPSNRQRVLFSNLLWFLGSLALAFLVWIAATFQSNPITQERFPDLIEVRLTPDAGMLITAPSIPSRTAMVVVRAPRSVQELLRMDEIELWADLTGLTPGEHTVDIQARLSRQPGTIVDISPSRIRLTLEESAQKQVPLRAVISSEAPAGYSRDEPVFDVSLNQVLVSGPASRVNEVIAAQAVLDLRQQRNPYEADIRLSAIDAEDASVSDVTIDPLVVHVLVNIRRRDDVREVSVRPNIQGEPPAGYVLNALSYEPQAVLVSGTPATLAALPETLTTAPIDLSEQTETFNVIVPVEIPDPSLIALSQENINVRIEISPVTTSRQFDNIPVEMMGAPPDTEVHLAPSVVSVLITGPQAQMDVLTETDIRVLLDLNGLTSGNYTLTPTVSLGQTPLPAATISVLPAEIDVEIAPITPLSTPNLRPP